MGSVLSFLVKADDVAGKLSLILAHARSGNEPPPHLHNYEHEIYYVLDGTMEFFCEGEDDSFVVDAGGMLFLPQGKAHAVYFRSPEVRTLVVGVAAGQDPVKLDKYFRHMAVGPATTMDLPNNAATYSTSDLKEAFEVAEAHGYTLLLPDEAAQRLPNYPGFGANLRGNDPA